MGEGVLKPFGPRVLIGEIGPIETIRESGIVLPIEVAEAKGLVQGLVLAVGDVPHLDEHMTVYFRKHGVYDIDGKIVVDAQDIIAYEEQ